jgi:hypothetical protein
MKHTLTVIVCAVALVVVGALSVQAYNKYEVQHNLHVAAVAASQAQAAKTAAAKASAFQTEQTSLKKVCQQELATYNTLTVAEKAKVTAPNCNLQFVE